MPKPFRKPAPDFARLNRSIWGDDDFKNLEPLDQLLYLKLISAGDMSQAGVLTYAPARWAGQSKGLEEEDIARSIGNLIEADFIRVDLRTTELLVRTYILHNEAWTQGNRMKPVRTAVHRVLSADLRRDIANELKRINPGDIKEAQRDAVMECVRELIDAYGSPHGEATPATPGAPSVEAPEAPDEAPPVDPWVVADDYRNQVGPYKAKAKGPALNGETESKINSSDPARREPSPRQFLDFGPSNGGRD